MPGNQVLLRSANNAWMAAAYLAVLKAGGVAVPTMPLLRAKELGFVLGAAGGGCARGGSAARRGGRRRAAHPACSPCKGRPAAATSQTGGKRGRCGMAGP